MDCTILVAKTKALISFAVTYAKSRFSHDAARIMTYELQHEKTCLLHIFENKGADQLCGKHAADQSLCFLYIGNTILLHPKSENSNL